jgi:hypothetical protein
LQLVDSTEDLPVQLDHRRACLPQATVLHRQAADTGTVGRWHGAGARAAGFTPGQHRGGMPLAAVLGAVAGGIAATGLHLVDGAFEQFADLQNVVHLAVIIRRQIVEDLPMVAGWGGRRHGKFLALQTTHRSHKATSVAIYDERTRLFLKSPEENAEAVHFFLAARELQLPALRVVTAETLQETDIGGGLS